MRGESDQRRPDETYALIRAAQSGDTDAKRKLVEQNAGLVNMSAKRFSSRTCEPEDMVQIGYMGLLKAIDRFDTEYGVMFSTYAVPMIVGEIRRYLRDDGKIKMSRSLKQDVKRLKAAEEQFTHENGRSPRISELADMIKKTVEETAQILEAQDTLSGIASLDSDALKDNIGMQQKFVTEERAGIIDLKNTIRGLDERERKIIVMRYFDDMTQQQIGRSLGISQVQVSRTEKKILEKMREKLSVDEGENV